MSIAEVPPVLLYPSGFTGLWDYSPHPAYKISCVGKYSSDTTVPVEVYSRRYNEGGPDVWCQTPSTKESARCIAELLWIPPGAGMCDSPVLV